MKAIVVRNYGSPEVMKIEEHPIPEAGASQVLVKVKAAGVNPVDTYIRAGAYNVMPPLPYTPGKDGAGIIEALGEEIEGFDIGDRVYIANGQSGTYAEYCLCNQGQINHLPENISFEQGAGVFVPYATAYRGLFQKAKIKAGELVFIHGASGGVGIAAIQWAKMAGARIIGTASTEEGRELILEQGADFALDHSSPDYLEEIKSITNGKGVDAVLEMLANINLQKDLEILAMHGRIVVIGNRGSLDFNPRGIMGKDAVIYGVALFNSSEADMKEIHEAIFNGLSEGYLSPIVGKSFSLAEAPKAHKEVIESKAFGKIILIP